MLPLLLAAVARTTLHDYRSWITIEITAINKMLHENSDGHVSSRILTTANLLWGVVAAMARQ